LPDRGWFKKVNWLLSLAWATAAALVFIGVTQGEKRLEDPTAIALLDYGLSKGDIEIVQDSPDRPLEVRKFSALPSPAATRGASGPAFDEERWARVRRLVRQFVAMANWGLGDPFIYERRADSAYVVAFHAADFTYRNPFDSPGEPAPRAPIDTSSAVEGRRPGWRVIGRDMVLFLRSGARAEPPVQLDYASSHGTCSVGGAFFLKGSGGAGLRLSIGSSAVAEDRTTRLQVEAVAPDGRVIRRERVRDGESFVWAGESFLAHNTEARAAPALVLTKQVNGRMTRVHLLGEATTNLIGASVGGYTPYLDGAIRHEAVGRLALTLDPELQAGSFFFLRNLLQKLDGNHPLGRQRRGSVTVLDLDTGGVLAQAGYPSFEPDRADNRRVLVDRTAVWRNPAGEAHMAGSTVKVMTVAMGYLLFGHAMSELLPQSRNGPAIRQAFQDAYGVELTAPLDGDAARTTAESRRQFEELGGPRRVRADCLSLLRGVFLVTPGLREAGQRERLVGDDMLRFFNAQRLEEELYPQPSYFPVLDADSLDRFRHYALGTEEARFTTLRLAAILGTASTGRVIRPFLVESVLDPAGGLFKPQAGPFEEMNLPVSEPGFRRAKMLEITSALRKVLLPGGTGFFYTDDDVIQYLGADKRDTPGVDESRTRAGDFGKSGTADYGKPEVFQDSLFVYRHGPYAIAVWLEHADGGEQPHPGHRPFERHPAHKLTDQLVSLIESLESNEDEQRH